MGQQVSIIKLSDVFDGTQSAEFCKEVTSALDSGANVVLVDCKDISFIDSSGLGALIIGLKLARERTAEFCLCHLNQQASMLIDLTDTRRLFKIFDTQEAFQQSLHPSQSH